MRTKGLRLRDRTRLAYGPVERKDLRRIELRSRASWTQVSDADVYSLVGVPDGFWTTEGGYHTVTKYDTNWRATGDTFAAEEVTSSEDRVRGIGFDGSSLWVVGEYEKVAEYDPVTGDLLSSFDYPATESTAINGIAFDGTYLWTNNQHFDSGPEIKRFTTDGVEEQHIALSIRLSGLSYWQGNIYLTHQARPEIVRMSTVDGNILGRIDVSDATHNPTGLWIAGDGTLYVSEGDVGVWRRTQRLAAP